MDSTILDSNRISQPKEPLTAIEMGKLWATYMGNTMAKCVISYYLQHVDDAKIKDTLESALTLSNALLEKCKTIFQEENFPIPTGLSEDDVNLSAPRLYDDEFYLHYLKYAGKAGLSIYSIAISLVTRDDVRELFIFALNSTVKLLTEVTDVLIKNRSILKPPHIPIPESVRFAKKQNYLNGFFGHIRPLHALEITHLYDSIEN